MIEGSVVRRAVLALTVVVLTAFPAFAQSPCWKTPTPESRLDQRVGAPGDPASARIKWDDGYIVVCAGATADRALALNRAHERALALTAARQIAYFKLAERVEGVAVDGVTLVKNAMVVDQTVRTKVSALVRGARVVSETVTDQPDGSVWAEVAVALALRGPGSLADAALTRPPAPLPFYQADPNVRTHERYTGLIVLASDTRFSPALAPRVLEQGSGRLIYGFQTARLAAVEQVGPMGYTPSLAEARANPRTGPNPLIVRAVAAAGERQGDLFLSPSDAERVAAADRDGRFLERAAVTVVLSQRLEELIEAPGSRHALLIGIDRYDRAVEGALPRLSYAVKDARAMRQALITRGGIAPENALLLEDRAATREGVVTALRALQKRVREEDTVIVYFSGHGTVGLGTDRRPHFYLLPHDGSMADLAGTALGDNLLAELIGQLSARRIIVILDTCYSSAGAGAVQSKGISNRAVGVPTRPFMEPVSGRVIISASKSDQVSLEDDRLGSGVLTFFILEGLDGRADVNRDGRVTALELYQYVEHRVRQYTRQHFRVDQTPVLDVRELSGDIIVAGRV